ncbi:hypothetical protein KC573_02955 [candidate division WWE3 bacterium]|uniref:Carboxypeptidase regulatory-like domain-containing protein n=1 Tax=candidate division WWE3 bacterium TaxID=2053526 RepID=A0A955RWE6_UNCKA|nr:hypothetical protein [candidate division WWE3 bacterium]
MNDITQPLEQKLAISRKNKTYLSVPGNLAFGRKIQLHSNQRTNRGLSRVSIGDTVTPIWHQQTFTPSSDLQKRFASQQIQEQSQSTPIDTAPISNQQTAPQITTAPIQPAIVQTRQASPIVNNPIKPNTSVQQPVSQQATPPQQAHTEPVESAPEKSIQQEPSSHVTLPETKQVQESMGPVNDMPTSINEPQTNMVQNPSTQPTPESTTIPVRSLSEQSTANTEQATIMSQTESSEPQDVSNQDIALSITALSDIRQQIKDQEEHLQSLQQDLPQTEEQATQYLAEMKTKEALIKNLEHALSNTQEELNMLRSTPGADTSIISNLEVQLKKQRDTFNNLKHEKKLIEEKQQALQKKKAEQTKVSQTINQLQQQSNQLSQPTPNTGQQPVTASIDPAVRDLINQSMAIEDQTPAKSTPQPQEQTQTPPAPRVNEPPKEIKMPTITKEKNAINGIVMNAANKLITDAIVIIKNEEGRPLRALKTNDLGQFWITTALEDGRYFIESEKEGFRFDTIEIELTGDVVPPILVKAK